MVAAADEDLPVFQSFMLTCFAGATEDPVLKKAISISCSKVELFLCVIFTYSKEVTLWCTHPTV